MKMKFCAWFVVATLLATTPYTSAEETSDSSATVGDVAATDSKVDEELYSTGELKLRKVVKINDAGETIRHGAWKMWDKQGNAIAEGHYQNDRRDGKWVRIHETLAPNFDLLSSNVEMVFAEATYNAFKMPFTSIATFKDGELNGTWRIQDAEKRIICEWNYADGLRDGTATWYYNNSAVMAEMNFREGVLDGKRQHFDMESNVVKDETWYRGRLLSLTPEYYDAEKTKLKSEGYYLGDGYRVHTKDDWWTGRAVTYAKAPSAKVELHGALTTYYETGEKESHGTYTHNKREGEFLWWFSNGKLSAKGNYKKDQLDGEWIWNHANGERETKGAYKMGKPVGLWLKWTEDGSLKLKKDFAGGQAEIVTTPKEDQEDAVKAAALIPLGKGSIR